jgi:hypothetical protein
MAAVRYYALARHDGEVEVMQTVGDATPQECLAKWAPIRRAEIASVREISLGDVPFDRFFRGAWVDYGSGKLVVGMSKARDILRGHLRQLRAPRLAALDVEMSKAHRNLPLQDDIEAQRQMLRDITSDPRIEQAQAPEELKALVAVLLP